MFFMALLTLVAATPTANAKRSIMELPLFERAVLIIKNLKRFISQSTGRRYAMVMSFSVENISHAGNTVKARLMLFFVVTMPNSASYIRNMDVTNIFLRLSLITLVPEPSIKAAF